MKTGLGLIRWKFVIPVGIFVGAIVVFFVVFFDPLLARGLEIAGSKVNGAKVEVEGLKTKLMQGRMDIKRIQVANKEQPMQNIVELGPIAFQIEFSHLLKKKVVIPEASIDGMQFNTPRKTSGALPKVKAKQEGEKSAAAKLASKYADRFMLNVSNVKFDAKQKVTFDPKETAINKQSEALKTKVENLPDQFEAKVKNLNVEDRLKQIEATLNSVKSTKVDGPEALQTVPEALKKLKTAKNDLNQLKKDVKAVRDDASNELKAVKSGVTGLKDAKQQDLNDILSRFNLDFLDPKRLVNGIIGPLVMERVQTVLGYVETARRVMPSKKVAESLPPKPRAKGEDIKFWSPAAPPTFWLKKSALSGSFQGISASGLLKHATSEPSKVGIPTTLDLKGSQGQRLFTGNITVDHVTDVSKDSLKLNVTGLDLVQMISTGALAGAVSAGTGAAEVAFGIVGDNIDGKVGMSLSKLKLKRDVLFQQVGLPPTLALNASREDKIKFGLMSNIAGAMENLPVISIQTDIGGTLNDPSLSISSNLDNEFAKIIKNSVGDVLADQRKEIEAELQAIVNKNAAEIEEKIASIQSKLNGVLGENDAKIQKEIDKAAGINLSSKEGGSPVNDLLNDLFKK